MKCERCNKKQKGKKSYQFVSLPPILCIMINRFNQGTNEKNENKIIFPVSNLNMSQYQSGANKNQSFIYDLFAVCNHISETTNTGHYTAYCKNPSNNKWYHYSNGISEIPEKDVCSYKAYLLFYKM